MIGGQADQKVHVIGNAADLDGMAPKARDGAGNVSVELVTPGWLDEW